MILAAGYGTRLRPLSDVRPKPLCPVWGEPLLDRWIRQAVREGFRKVVINAHHMPHKLREHVQRRTWPIPVHVIVEKEILGTGGGVRNALDLLGDDPFVVVNGDVAAHVSLRSLWEKHATERAPVTLLLCRTGRFDSVAVTADRTRITGFFQPARGSAQASCGPSPTADRDLWTFSGIQVVDPSWMGSLPRGRPFHVIDLYRDWIARGVLPAAVCCEKLPWHDVGSLETYWDLHAAYERHGEIGTAFLEIPPSGLRVHSSATVGPSADLSGCVVLGQGTVVGEGCVLRNVVVWDRCALQPGSDLENCIVTDGAVVSGRHRAEIFLPSGDTRPLHWERQRAFPER
ncbi:MAG: NDP-sugar synthase [Desulfosoma sp.]